VKERLEARLDRALVQLTLRRAVLVIIGLVLLLAVVAAFVELLVDPEFDSVGTALWWSIQTVTTVGYGDVIPDSTAGRFSAAVLMLVGVAFIPIMTSVVVSILVAQHTRVAQEEQLQRLDEIAKRLDSLDRRLAGLEGPR
jgi:voltage-gated potassium channel Kch